MPDGILQSLPDTGIIEQARSLSQGQLSDALGNLTGDPASFVDPLLQALNPVGDGMPTDSGAWTGSVSGLLSDVEGLIPADISEWTGPVMEGLGGIRPLVEDSPMGQMLADLEGGQSFTDIAMAQLNNATGDVMGQLTGSISNVLSGENLAEATAFISALADLQSTPPSDASQLLAFISESMLGVSPDLLDAAAAISQQRFNGLESLQEAVGPALDALETEVANRLAAVVAHLGTFDPAQEAAYNTLIDLLNQANGALTALANGLGAIPTAVGDGLQALDLDNWVSQLRTELQALPALDLSSLHQIADQLIEPLTRLNTLLDSLDPAQLVAQLHSMLEAVIQAVDRAVEAVTGNPVFAFFDDLRDQVQILDTQAIQDGIDGALNSIQGIITAFDMGQVIGVITDALDAVEAVFDAIDLDGAINACVAVVQGIADFLEAIPLGDVTAAVDTALSAVDGLITALDAGSQDVVTQIQAVLDALGNLSFYPLAEPAVEAIEELTALIEEIDLSVLPSAMADPLRELCQAFKDSFDPSPGQYFQEEVVQVVDDAFAAVEEPLRDSIDSIDAKLEEVADQIRGYDPAELLAPLSDVVDQLLAAMEDLSGQGLIEPVETVRQDLLGVLNGFSPEDLFAPLEEAYGGVLSELEGFSPGDLLQPLIDLYNTVDELVQSLDIGGHLEGLNDSSTDMFNTTHSQLMGAFDLSGLPSELGDLTGQVQPLLDMLAPGVAPDQMATNLQSYFENLKPGNLLDPLQGLYDQLLSMLDAVPETILVDAFVDLKAQLVGNLEAVNPSAIPTTLQTHLGSVSTVLATNVPQAVAGGLQTGYQELSGAFGSIDAGAVPVSLQPLYQQAQVLVASLNPEPRLGPLQASFEPLAGQIDAVGQALDLAGLAGVFAPIGNQMDRLVPEFLSGEMTVDAIRDGMQALSPAALAIRVNEPFDQFYTRIQALSPALQSEYESFLDTLGDKLMQLSPFIVFDTFREIYQAIVDQLLFIDPQAIADALNEEIYEPLLDQFRALHPRNIREAVQETYDRLVGKIENLDLAAVAAALDAVLTTLRTTLDDLKGIVNAENLRETFGNIADTLSNLPIIEVFEALVEAFTRLRQDLSRTLTVAATAFDEMIVALPS